MAGNGAGLQGSGCCKHRSAGTPLIPARIWGWGSPAKGRFCWQLWFLTLGCRMGHPEGFAVGSVGLGWQQEPWVLAVLGLGHWAELQDRALGRSFEWHGAGSYSCAYVRCPLPCSWFVAPPPSIRQ